ncbi:hypothetical protein V5799_014314 [Amblyomma americanum]|uniref:Uncharacterized protein n=1 Tax=Amblyomma americanum TaxID=6943 RepID=A0AAQ4E3E4_AMBAM
MFVFLRACLCAIARRRRKRWVGARSGTDSRDFAAVRFLRRRQPLDVAGSLVNGTNSSRGGRDVAVCPRDSRV